MKLEILDFLGKIKVGFDFANDLCYDVCHKSCDEDTRPRKDSQRGLCLVQKACNPAVDDTTSELRGRNAPPGAPVNASMSDGCAVTRVEPWNTLYPTPDEFSGDGIIFVPSPNWVMQNSKCKMQNSGAQSADYKRILPKQNISSRKAYRVHKHISNALAYIDCRYVYLTINSIYYFIIRYINLAIYSICFVIKTSFILHSNSCHLQLLPLPSAKL